MTEQQPIRHEYVRGGRRKRLGLVLRRLRHGADDDGRSITLELRLQGGRPVTDRHVEEMEEDLGPDDRQGPDDGRAP
jgi:hypothetical protein